MDTTPAKRPPPATQPWAAQPAAALPGSLLARWEQFTTAPGTTVVLPDGCCDLIVRVDAAGTGHWHVSALADAVLAVPGAAHEFWRGYRLRPGTTVQAAALVRAAQAVWLQAARQDRRGSAATLLDATVEHRLLDAIDTHTHLAPRVQEALEALAQPGTVAAAARSLGVSERSLERLTRATNGQTPGYWRALARVRRAARDLASGEALAAIAADHGYADQAHFSRDCLRWLGQPPSVLRSAPERLATLAQPGYG